MTFSLIVLAVHALSFSKPHSTMKKHSFKILPPMQIGFTEILSYDK